MMSESMGHYERVASTGVLLAEADMVLKERGANLALTAIEDRIDTINRGVRASLRPKKPTSFDELYGTETNCFGAVRALIEVANNNDIALLPAIVERYPWQEDDARREIHIVAAHINENSDGVIIADPMPLPSYSCGTTRTGQRSGDKIKAYDAVLGGYVDYKILHDAEIWAIGQVFEGDIVAAGDTQEGARILEEAYQYLEDIPSYRVRIARLLSKYAGYRGEALRLFDQEAPNNILGQYDKFLPHRQAEEVRAITNLQKERQQDLLPAVSEALATAGNVDERNYWLRILEDFSDIPRDPNVQVIAEAYSRQDFAQWPDDQSIRRYELFMSWTHPRYIQSNLYTCEMTLGH